MPLKAVVLKSDTDYRKYCESESNAAYTVANKNQEEYDKQLLALSAGLLGVLLAFIKDIVPLLKAVWMHVLYWSYAILGTCVISVLVSFQLSIFALRKVRSHWRAEYEKRDSSIFPFGWATGIFVLNIANGLIFAAGLVLCLCFIVKNMSRPNMDVGVTMPNKPLQEGSNPKLPMLPSKEERGSNLKVPLTRPNSSKNSTSNSKTK